MRKVSLKHFNRLPLTLILTLALGLSLFGWLFLIGIQSKEPLLIVLCSIIFSTVLIGLGGFYGNYGITISSKRISIVYANALNFFRFEDVSYIEIILNEDMICGEVKVKGQPAYIFVLDEFELSQSFLFSRFFKVKVRLSPKRANKFAKQAVGVDKIRIDNRLENKKQ